jgi:CheY-like chemotaxis protein
VNRAALRQALLSVLTFAVAECAEHHVEIGGRAGAERVELCVAARPSQPRADLLSDTRLVVIERLIGLQGGDVRLETTATGDVVVWIGLRAAPSTTVLVIDDNPDFARLFQRYLWAGGYQMIQAGSGAQALQLVRESQPSVITLDVMMPSQDGWEVLSELHRDEATRDIPVVVCSVLRERELALALGATDFLSKPVTQQALLAVLERCLSS